MTKEQLTSSSFYTKLYESNSFKDSITRGELVFKLLERAKELRIKSHVEKQINSLEKRLHDEEQVSKKSLPQQSTEGITNFLPDDQSKEYDNLFCGSWIATEDGIWSQESSRANQVACYHPILPVNRMRNLETGEEQITLAFKRRNGGDSHWQEITVAKDMIANARTISGLAKYGIAVTSESAKLLVRYLADVENYNDDKILLKKSSSKLGWHDSDKVFLPYDGSISFDAGLRFPQIYNAVSQNGSYEKWLEHIKKIRADSYVEPRIALAASFSSVLIKFLNISSVIVDFWGSTEAGKTVMLMVAASVWACPDEGQYMGDFLTTDAELEVRSDMLNNFPLILDDTAKMKKNIRDNIEQVIYNLASGSGKKRSNKDLGSERVRTWKNTVIVNGERPLNSFVEQGGAINRIIEVGLNEERLFESPSETAEIVRANYGFAGRVFVEHIKEIGDSKAIKKELKEIHDRYCRLLESKESMQKQVLSMAAILTADELATKYIFQDDRALKPDEIRKYLTERQSISEGARCYQYLIGVYLEKGQHFDPSYDNVDQWGEVEYDKDSDYKYINFYVNQFGQLMKDGGFSRKAFTSWAKREDLLRWNTSQDRDIYGVRPKDANDKVIQSQPQKRFISVRIVSDLDEYEAEKHMFD